MWTELIGVWSIGVMIVFLLLFGGAALFMGIRCGKIYKSGLDRAASFYFFVVGAMGVAYGIYLIIKII